MTYYLVALAGVNTVNGQHGVRPAFQVGEHQFCITLAGAVMDGGRKTKGLSGELFALTQTTGHQSVTASQVCDQNPAPQSASQQQSS